MATLRLKKIFSDITTTIAKNTILFSIGNVLSGIGNYVLLIIYTQNLNLAQFGVYALIESTILIFATIFRLGLNVSYLKWFSEVEESNHADLLSSTLIISGISSLIGGAILLIVLHSPLSTSWFQDVSNDFIWMLLPIIVLEGFQIIFLSDIRARNKVFLFLIVNITRIVLTIGLTFWFIAIQELLILGVFAGRLIANTIVTVGLFIINSRNLKLRIKKQYCYPVIKYGFPLVWSALSAILLDASGRYMLGYYSTLDQVGLYSAAIKVASIFQLLFSQPFGMAWGGLMFQIIKWPNAREVYSNIFTYTFVSSMAVALVMTLLSPVLFNLFVPLQYHQVIWIFPLFLLVRAISVMEYPASIGIYLSGKTWWFPLFYTIGFVVNVCVSFLLVHTYDIFGIVISYLMSWAIIIILMVFQGQRYYHLHFNKKIVVLALLPWIVIVANMVSASGVLSK